MGGVGFSTICMMKSIWFSPIQNNLTLIDSKECWQFFLEQALQGLSFFPFLPSISMVQHQLF
jgi:hypothetical protein